jgi:type II secretory ATPase GspE/PulE/Tfp pilus assembly ATPase PilB-like protein
MLSLGVHPPFLASALLGAVAQRLARTLCPKCKQSFDLGDAPHTFEEVKAWLEPGQGQFLFGPAGCPACYGTGYAGRTGVFEVLAVNRDIRKLILQKQPIQVIRDKAIESGLIEFRHSALLKVARGDTSVEEVFRVVPTEYLGLED